mmetsp:Transcript_744/g.2235  ORF Transcript_744/g.2235 Transcript_744/m.2235 type:complete len:384 (-) Transcript_744:102-1253(-)
MAGGGAGGGADSELVPLSDGDAYGATTREESEGVKLEDFKPDAPLWVLDRTIREKEQLKFQKLIEAASAKAPGRCSKCLETCAPCLACGAVTCSVCIPIYANIAYYIAAFVSKLPTDVFGIVWGLCLVFFGGFYPLTMAAFEAFRQCGGEDTYEALHDIAVELSKAKKASAADDLVDDDHDGVADVEQISGTELVKRKHNLFLKTTDPYALDRGFKGVYTAWIAVVAVLKVQFAQMIALGAAIGDFLGQLLRVPATQIMVHLMSKETHKWIPTYINYSCKAIAVAVAYYVQKILAAAYSATRGGLMVFRSLFAILDRKGIVHLDPSETYADEVLGWTLAAIGFYFQYTQMFSPPFIVELLLWPLQMTEYGLLYAVSTSKAPAA